MQAFHHDVPALLVGLPDVLHAFLRPVQGDDGSHLHRREAAVVVVALDASQRVHELRIADHESDAPPRHVVALRHGEELDRHVARARHLHDGRRLVVVEHDVGVREIVHDHNVVFFCQRNYFLEKRQVDALRGRIRRKAEDQHFRLGGELADRALELGEEVHPRRHAHRADVGAGDDRAVDVDRVRRVGHQHRVAAVQGRQHQVREALLGADGDDGLAVRVERNAVAPLVPVADRPAQPRDAFRHGIPVGILPLRRFDQLIDDVPGRRPVGVAHRQVDDVLAAPARRHLQLVGDVEDVGRKALNP